MKRLVCAAVVVVLLTGSVAAMAAEDKSWRVGASWIRLTESHLRSILGDGWGIGAEYSFGNLVDGLAVPMDLSGAVSYRHFSKSSNSLNNASVGIKWRAGPGASPADDGFYGGVGLGAAFIQADIPSLDERTIRFQWSLFGGANFAEGWYGEVGYSHVGDGSFANFSNWIFTIGRRL